MLTSLSLFSDRDILTTGATLSMSHRLSVGIIGLGGFARDHHRVLWELEKQSECRVVCACDPDQIRQQSGTTDFQFTERGIPVYADYREMLRAQGDTLDVVTIPTPVPLHAEMHRACVEAGIACYLEKPPTLYDVELEEMIAADVTANKRTNVGFNFIIEEPRQSLKTRLLNGEFGVVQQVRLLGLWPRANTYFTRANWAGRLRMQGRPVLDSIFGNAMAHYVHNVLFWAGQKTLFDWAEVKSVTAEMYRTHAIEGTDTLFATAQTYSGIELRFAMTHACSGAHRQREEILCEKAHITYTVGGDYHILWKNGSEETGSSARGDLLLANIAAYLRYVQGDSTRPLTLLEDSRPFVRFNNLAYIAAGKITTIPSDSVDITYSPDGENSYRTIHGIESATERFLNEGVFPTEQGFAWAQSGGTAHDSERPSLLETLHRLCLDNEYSKE